MKLNLNTIILFVQNVDKLRLFYVDIFGLEVIEETASQWLLLKAGNCNIGLHKIGEQYADANAATFKFDNNTKIVFETDEEIYALRENLLAKNVALKEIVTWDNYNYLMCDGEDPEGNVFQIKYSKTA